jgi:putative ABC transport system permease protein
MLTRSMNTARAGPGSLMPERLARRFVPADMRDRVFDEAAREIERAYYLRRRRARSALSRAGVDVWRLAQLTQLAFECRRLARPTLMSRESSGGGMTMLLNDLRFGARAFLKTPGFTLVAVFTLALGIGGTAATFSVVQHVLLRGLPYPAADRVMYVNEWARGRGMAVSPPNFMDWQADNRSFASLAMYQEQNLTLSAGEPERIDAIGASPELFDVLAVRPLLGRTFTAADARPGAPQVAVIGYSLWQRRFGGDPALVGRSITLEGEPYAVVGVMPDRFDFPEDIQLWVPLVFTPANLGPNQRGAHYVSAIGRLKDGVTPEQAQADLDGIEQRLAREFPSKLAQYSVHVDPFLNWMVSGVRRPLLVLLGAVGFVLLIACVNVSNLLLARATTRTGEIAVRSALGAGRRRIVWQLLMESLLLAGAGGLAGLMLTIWGVHALASIAPADLPRGIPLSVNPSVLTFVVLLSLVTSIVFGVIPALIASKADMSGFLKDVGRGSETASGRRSLRNVLVAAEVALSLVLLTGAGLAMRSFDRLTRVNAGFDPSNVLTFDIRLPAARYVTTASDENFFREFTARLKQPGIRSAGAIFMAPLSGGGFGGSFTLVGRAAGSDEGNAQVRPITPGYLESLRIPLLAGRVVSIEDRAGGPGVAFVNETAARRYWSDGGPLGKRVRIHVSMGVAEKEREVVGVVGDVRIRGLDIPPEPMIYVPASQYVSDEMTYVVRTDDDPRQALTIAKTQLSAMDREVALSEVRTMDEAVAASMSQPRFRTTILGIFAAIALALAAVGLYGAVAFNVNQRRAELGLRMALGAHRNDVLRLVLRQGLTPVVLGIALGLGGAVVLTRVMRTLLFDVSAQDPLTFVAVAGTLFAVAVAACYVPARRAMVVDPVRVLR